MERGERERERDERERERVRERESEREGESERERGEERFMNLGEMGWGRRWGWEYLLFLLMGSFCYELIHLCQLHGRTVVDHKEGTVT